MATLFLGEGYMSPSELEMQFATQSVDTIHRKVNTDAMNALDENEQDKQSFNKGVVFARNMITVGFKGETMKFFRSDIVKIYNRDAFVEGMNSIFVLDKNQTTAHDELDMLSKLGNPVWEMVVTVGNRK